MRLWSIHPSYLDAKGLVAAWREALLAKRVLEGKTRGYKNHPQLTRFKKTKKPLLFINSFLKSINDEACERGYCFDAKKIGKTTRSKMTVTRGQLEYEFEHLKKKLKERDRKKHAELSKVKVIKPNALFKVIEGGAEEWEKTE